MEQVKLLLLGMLVAAVMMMLMGAGGSEGPGRYQIAGASGTSFYVLDTHSGKIIRAGGRTGGGDNSATAAVEEAKAY